MWQRADDYSDERAKDLILSLRRRIDALSWGDVCRELGSCGMLASQTSWVSQHDCGTPLLEAEFLVDPKPTDNLLRSIESVLAHYECVLYKISYDRRHAGNDIASGYYPRYKWIVNLTLQVHDTWWVTCAGFPSRGRC